MLIKKYNTLANRKAWQAFLNTQGYKLVVDGIDGPATTSATKSFQTSVVTHADGIVGDGTVAQAKHRGFAGFSEEYPVSDVKSEIAKPETPGTPVAVLDKNIARLDGLCPSFAEKVKALVQIAANEGHTLRVVQGLRTFPEQDKLFNQWRDGKDNDGDGRVDESDERVTRAAGGQSNHNYGLAADLAFVVPVKQKDGSVKDTVTWDDSLYPRIGGWAARVGLAWGGNWKFKDLPHVEVKGLPKWPVLLATFKQGGLAAVWAKYS